MRERARIGMAMFLINEAVLFFLLGAAFVYFRGTSLRVAAGSLDVRVTAIYTVCLAASSFTMWRAVAAARYERKRDPRPWVAATLVLGSVFLLGQAGEYARLGRLKITVSENLFGTTFFTLTGMHGLHVLAGIVLLGILLAIAGPADAGERQSVAVETVALYWYFVDLVWIAIFSIVYLWTFL